MLKTRDAPAGWREYKATYKSWWGLNDERTLAKARGVFCSASRPQHPTIHQSTILKGEARSERSEHNILQYPLSRRGVKGETPCGSKLELPVGNSARVPPAQISPTINFHSNSLCWQKEFYKRGYSSAELSPQWGKKWRCKNKLISTSNIYHFQPKK